MANATQGADVIEFQIGASDPGFEDADSGILGGDAAPDVFVIRPLSALPALTDTTGGTVIDGASQSSFSNDANPFGPEIVLDGSMIAGTASGLAIHSNLNEVFGLNIQQFKGNGIIVYGGSSNWVYGNYIGTDATGIFDRGNGFEGVHITGDQPSFNTIGTNGDNLGDADERNIISGNDKSGVTLGASSALNNIAGNYIGTDRTSNFSIGNNYSGVTIWGGLFNTVGTNGNGVADENERNIISGNNGNGVNIDNSSNGNIIAGNNIGTDATGLFAVGNLKHGVLVNNSSSQNTIGTDGNGIGDTDERNLISANGNRGVSIVSSSNENVVAGNFIGTNIAGDSPLGNSWEGVYISTQQNRVGTNGDGVADISERNLISGNAISGITLGIGSTSNTVAGNFIGTDKSGSSPLGNGDHGVLIWGGGFNTIGTNGDGLGDIEERNIISANARNGVEINNSSNNNTVAGNFIGTDVTGMLPLGNLQHGVLVFGNSLQNTIGTNGNGVGDSDEGNVLSANGYQGVSIYGSNNTVAGNNIGTNRTGTSSLANIKDGIFVSGNNNTIGTNGDGNADQEESNLISGNSFHGIKIVNATRITIAGNYIGTDASGLNSIPNSETGIHVTESSYITIGTNGDGIADISERNVISGNSKSGVTLGAGSTLNSVAGNYIGTDRTGTISLGNNFNGVTIFGGQFNTIGTNGNGVSDAIERNIISGNNGTGVRIDSNGNSNIVAGNYIGTDITGMLPLGNLYDGVLIINQSSQNTIGTDGNGFGDLTEANIISANSKDGVEINNESNSNTVAGNYIGTDRTGASPLGNGATGVSINGSQSNTIGTNGNGLADANEKNLISGNQSRGVAIGNYGIGNTVAGNFIGTDLTGLLPMGNAVHGIVIFSHSSQNIIGTDGNGVGDADERNLISDNGHNGVEIINNSSDNTVAGNLIGTDVTGINALGNKQHGVLVFDNSSNNTIGTDGNGLGDSEEGNVISANIYPGVSINGSSNNNIIAGNRIGTNISGTLPLGNQSGGIYVSGNNNTIGTNGDNNADLEESNLISGNSSHGILIENATDITIAGNYIGTDGNGSYSIPNISNGIRIISSTNITIGTNGNGTGDLSERNIISGNGEAGIKIFNTHNSIIAGNYVGVDASGVTSLGNNGAGIRIEDNSSNIVIGTNGDGLSDATESNVISGNSGSGIYINESNENKISGNTIGLDATGSTPKSNGLFGIWVGGTASSNVIGTDGNGEADDIEGNVISGNTKDGITITGLGTNRNRISGNLIGLDATGLLDIGNGHHGIRVLRNAQNTIVGTNGNGISDNHEKNIISGNGRHGITIAIGASYSRIAGNFIGTSSTGSQAIPNELNGINIANSAEFTTIGTNGDGVADDIEGNLISGNIGNGIVIYGDGILLGNNTVSGNLIGTDVTGMLPIGNQANGILITNSSASNIIGTNNDGTSDSHEKNVISGNTESGILIENNSQQNNVYGNFIGTDATGVNPIGNGLNGITLSDGASFNRIGSSGVQSNIISNNHGSGIVVSDLEIPSIGNTIRGNSMTNNGFLGIDLGSLAEAPESGDGVTFNDLYDFDQGPNEFQNYPTITEASYGDTTRIVGIFKSVPNSSYLLDFYRNPTSDDSNHGEGANYLGEVNIETNSNGEAPFDIVLPISTNVGDYITSTATSPFGSTSEYSLNVLSALTIGLLVGDFNMDDILSNDDIDLLSMAINENNDNPIFDLNHDSEINTLDGVFMLANIMGISPGDFNSDHQTDVSDLSTWATGFGSGTLFSQGDSNFDGQVDVQDLSQWATDFGKTTQPPAPIISPSTNLVVTDSEKETSPISYLLDTNKSNPKLIYSLHAGGDSNSDPPVLNQAGRWDNITSLIVQPSQGKRNLNGLNVMQSVVRIV